MNNGLRFGNILTSGAVVPYDYDASKLHDNEVFLDWKEVTRFWDMIIQDATVEAIIRFIVRTCIKNGIRIESSRHKLIESTTYNPQIEEVCYNAIMYFMCTGLVPITGVDLNKSGYHVPVIPSIQSGIISIFTVQKHIKQYRWWELNRQTNTITPSRKVLILHNADAPDERGNIKSIMKTAVNYLACIKNSWNMVQDVETHCLPTVLLTDKTKVDVNPESMFGIYIDAIAEQGENARYIRTQENMRQITSLENSLETDARDKVKASLAQQNINNNRPNVHKFVGGVDYQSVVKDIDMRSAIKSHSMSNSFITIPHGLDVNSLPMPSVVTDPLKWREVLYNELSIFLGVPKDNFVDPSRGTSLSVHRVVNIAHETISHWQSIFERVLLIGYHIAMRKMMFREIRDDIMNMYTFNEFMNDKERFMSDKYEKWNYKVILPRHIKGTIDSLTAAYQSSVITEEEYIITARTLMGFPVEEETTSLLAKRLASKTAIDTSSLSQSPLLKKRSGQTASSDEQNLYNYEMNKDMD